MHFTRWGLHKVWMRSSTSQTFCSEDLQAESRFRRWWESSFVLESGVGPERKGTAQRPKQKHFRLDPMNEQKVLWLLGPRLFEKRKIGGRGERAVFWYTLCLRAGEETWEDPPSRTKESSYHLRVARTAAVDGILSIVPLINLSLPSRDPPAVAALW